MREVGEILIYFFLFAVLHSVCVREKTKTITANLLGEGVVRGFYRLVFTIGSFFLTGMLFWLIFKLPDKRIYTVGGFLGWLMHGIQILGLFLGVYTFRKLDYLRFLGIRQAVQYIRGDEIGGDMEGVEETGLIKTGAYGIVRHPLYLAGILIFTFEPNITRNWLTVSILADIYFIYGAFSEERRLILRFGKEYEEYRKQVPMFLPFLK